MVRLLATGSGVAGGPDRLDDDHGLLPVRVQRKPSGVELLREGVAAALR
jgi:hypothetical protein